MIVPSNAARLAPHPPSQETFPFSQVHHATWHWLPASRNGRPPPGAASLLRMRTPPASPEFQLPLSRLRCIRAPTAGLLQAGACRRLPLWLRRGPAHMRCGRRRTCWSWCRRRCTRPASRPPTWTACATPRRAARRLPAATRHLPPFLAPAGQCVSGLRVGC